jgi:endonuclease NucS-like protein
MTHIGAWEIADGETPRRMPEDREFLERHLEAWIERDPSLLGGDIRWVSRQLVLPDGSRLDLLGLTKDNTWVIAELKAGQVNTSTVLQAMHYFVQIAAMSDAELAQRIRSRNRADDSLAVALSELVSDSVDTARDYRLLVAGVGGGDSAEAAASILARYGLTVRIQVVSFQLLRDSLGRRVLLREIEEDALRESRNATPYEDILVLAERFGVRDGFEQIRTELVGRGYRTFQKRSGLNFSIGSRLQTFWVKPVEGRLHVGYLSGNFPELYGIDESTALRDLGTNWIDLPAAEAVKRVSDWANTIDQYRAKAGERGQPVAPASTRDDDVTRSDDQRDGKSP